jgi:DNA-binding MarR family transcriptional regulator
MGRIGILTTEQTYAQFVKVDRIIRSSTNQLLKQHKLTLMEWLLLNRLLTTSGKVIKVSEIAEHLAVSLPHFTALTNGLISKRLARQSTLANDKRSHVLVITKKGEDILEELQPKMYQLLRKIFINVQPGEVAAYQDVLKLITGEVVSD